ncbi:MAG: VRR-NUC domain-containing protein [Clostridia bacterium]|nr:VRR-NUC domain-containing protein [Clostridia bacterium]
MKEKDLIKKIMQYLKAVPELFCWKEHGGQFGTAGIPDIIICFKGKFIALEVKVGKNKPTILQEVTIRRILKAGGYALVVRSVEETKQVIQALSKE